MTALGPRNSEVSRNNESINLLFVEYFCNINRDSGRIEGIRVHQELCLIFLFSMRYLTLADQYLLNNLGFMGSTSSS